MIFHLQETKAMIMTQFRTRIAPSPTGDPHVGTAYIALFNYCFAKQHDGKFILRIEDTDRLRSTSESEQKILDSLQWVGLHWDEGPDVGGPYGPYRQSERGEIYRQYALELVKNGHAFYCFRSKAEVEAIREQRRAEGLSPGFKLTDPDLSEEEINTRLEAGDPYVIRLRVPEAGVCVVKDKLRGDIEIDWSMVDMQVLLKSDGMPTYHLANVVDDHLMKITHVIRGEEWINSTPKHILLYQYFAWDLPEFCHMPLLRNPDKSKLSKRKNPTSITYYERMGYLPEALCNYLGRMGWSMPDQSEKFSLNEMIQHFSIDRVSTSGPVFDQEKLDWLNGVWIREDLDSEELLVRFQHWSTRQGQVEKLLPLVHQRIEKMSDIVPLIGFMFAGNPGVNNSDFEEGSKLALNDQRRLLQFLIWQFEKVVGWHREQIEGICTSLSNDLQFKLRDFMFPVFIAIAGTKQTIDIMDAMTILGSDLTRARLVNALKVLGTPSKKELKKWEKEFKQIQS